MSAECHECGADIVYPVGTWPLGECPRCTVLEKARKLTAERDYYRRRWLHRSRRRRRSWGPDHPSYDEMGQ